MIEQGTSVPYVGMDNDSEADLLIQEKRRQQRREADALLADPDVDTPTMTHADPES